MFDDLDDEQMDFIEDGKATQEEDEDDLNKTTKPTVGQVGFYIYFCLQFYVFVFVFWFLICYMGKHVGFFYLSNGC